MCQLTAVPENAPTGNPICSDLLPRVGGKQQAVPLESVLGASLFSRMEISMSGSCPSASDKSEGQAGFGPPDGGAVIVKADGSV